MNSTSEPDRPRFSLKSLFYFIAIAAVFFGLVGIIKIKLDRHNAEREEWRALNLAAEKSIVKDLEAIQTKLGRAPSTTLELASQLGKSIPVIHAYGNTHPINYYHRDDGSFQLDYISPETFNIRTRTIAGSRTQGGLKHAFENRNASYPMRLESYNRHAGSPVQTRLYLVIPLP